MRGLADPLEIPALLGGLICRFDISTSNGLWIWVNHFPPTANDSHGLIFLQRGGQKLSNWSQSHTLTIYSTFFIPLTVGYY